MSAEYLLQIFSLTGKTAILTGATGGLGKSLALALAKVGASIVSIEIPNDPESDALKKTISEEARGSVRSFTCDLAKTADLRACYASIWGAGIVPDILVNCAGVARTDACEDATDDDIDLVRWHQSPIWMSALQLQYMLTFKCSIQMISVNMKATYTSCQEFGRKLLELNRPGKIINIASVTAFQANRHTSVYAATKGAVVQMTKAFSNEWASKGIQVNCISPG